jgi:hypothetical protein
MRRVLLLIGWLLFSVTFAAEEGEKKEETPPEAKEEKKPEAKFLTGEIVEYQLTTRMFKKAKNYFSEALAGKKMLKFYNLTESCTKRVKPQKDPEKLLDYDVTKYSTYLYVPPEYDGGKEWGLYVHLGEEKAGVPIEESWKEVLLKRKLIYASPNACDGYLPDLLRVAQALDTVATITFEYPINRARVIIGGENTGAKMAMMATWNYPKIFSGVICVNDMLLIRKTEYGELATGKLIANTADFTWEAEANYIGSSETKKLLKLAPPLALVAGGERENISLEKVLRGSCWLRRGGFNYEVFDNSEAKSPRTVLDDKWLDKVIGWLEKEQVDIPAPRYDIYNIRLTTKH